MAPEVRVGAIEEDATHARFGCIDCAEEERIFGDNFGQVGGTVGEVVEKRVGRFWLQIQSYELETRNIENGTAR